MRDREGSRIDIQSLAALLATCCAIWKSMNPIRNVECRIASMCFTQGCNVTEYFIDCESFVSRVPPAVIHMFEEAIANQTNRSNLET